jgi:ABC-type glycerol-3-phosphate transport system substrate-binding protein
MQGMMNGSIALMASEINGTTQVALPYTAAGAEDGGMMAVPALSGPGTVYTPVLLAGINAQSPRRDLAEEFLRRLYSPDIQELDQTDGLPAVASSLDRLFDQARERSKDNRIRMMISTGSGNPIEMRQPDNAAWDTLRVICGALDHPYAADDTLMGFMVEETASFFAGRASAQEAARAVQQRAAAYLNE